MSTDRSHVAVRGCHGCAYPIAHALVLHNRHHWKGDWRRLDVGARTRAAVRCLEAHP